MKRCQRCGEPIWVWPWQNAYCRDFERCLANEWLGLVVWGHEEPEPLWFEQPPEDLDKCSLCSGFGQVVRLDWESGPVYEPCQRCDTTGKDPSLCPV